MQTNMEKNLNEYANVSTIPYPLVNYGRNTTDIALSNNWSNEAIIKPVPLPNWTPANSSKVEVKPDIVVVSGDDGSGMQMHFGNQVKFIPEVKRIVIDPPKTVVLWNDGTKTIVSCKDGEEFSPEHGVAMAIARRYFGTRNKFRKAVAGARRNDLLKKEAEEKVEEKTETKPKKTVKKATAKKTTKKGKADAK